MKNGLSAIAILLALAIPASAQATQHWYKNNILIPEGSQVPTLIWGTTTISNTSGSETCRTVMGGEIHNGAAGSAGLYFPAFYDSFDCISPECEALRSQPLMKIHNSLSEWGGGLGYTSATSPPAWFEIGGVQLQWNCPERTEGFTGSLNFTIENGTSVGAAPMKLRFTNEPASGQTFAGVLKLMGYEGQEAIAAK